MKRLSDAATIGLCVCLLAGAAIGRADDIGEDKGLLQSVFVYNFAKFTRWPMSAWSTPDAPLRLCIAGHDDLSDSLALLRGETVAARPIEIDRDVREGSLSACHVLYVARSAKPRIAALLDEVADHPVLTVSRLARFADRGGIIQLYREDDRIRFRINIDAARRSGLQLSARLLELADVIGNGGTR